MFSLCSIQPERLAMPSVDDDDLPFKVVRTNSLNEVVARAGNLLVGRAAHATAARMYPRDRIEYRHGALVMERNYSDDGRTG
jgi:hypothetical protein